MSHRKIFGKSGIDFFGVKGMGISSTECEHFKYGQNWVANRNILFKPNGDLVVLRVSRGSSPASG